MPTYSWTFQCPCCADRWDYDLPFKEDEDPANDPEGFSNIVLHIACHTCDWEHEFAVDEDGDLVLNPNDIDERAVILQRFWMRRMSEPTEPVPLVERMEASSEFRQIMADIKEKLLAEETREMNTLIFSACWKYPTEWERYWKLWDQEYVENT
jgi:hypothetical protein